MIDLAQLGFRVESLEAEVASQRLDKMSKSAKKAETASERLAKQAAVTGKAMQSMGRNMSLYVTTPILGMAAVSVKFASDFESSFANVRKTVDATEKQFAQMSGEIRKLAQTVPTAVEELNRLAGVAGQLGVRRENIVGFTHVIAMLGDTTDIAGEQAALSLSRFMNVMGTAQGDIDRVGSTIVGLGNNFAAMESEIIITATSMAAFGRQVGLTEAQVLAFATAIAASGGHTEAASTAFQKTASTMQQAVIEINKDLQVFANVAGISADKFSRAFREDAAGAIQLFLQGLKRISDEGLSTASVLDKVGLADQRLQREFGKLLGNLDQLDSALVQSSDEWERNTALTEEAEKRYKTFASEMSVFKNQIKDVAIELGTSLLPHIRSMRDDGDGLIAMLRRWVTAFDEADSGTQKLILRIIATAAVMGPLLLVMGSMIRTLAVMVPWFVALHGVIVAKLLPAIRLTMIRFAGLAGSFGLFFSPAGLIFAGIAALGLLAFAMRDTGREATELDGEIDALIKSMEEFGKTSFDLAVGKLNIAIAENDSVVGRLQDNLQVLQDMQSRPQGAAASDRMAMQMAEIALQIEVAKTEGAHLEEQLIKLTKAQTDLNAAIANDELMARYTATMKELADNFKFLDEQSGAAPVFDAESFAELLDIIDPTTKALKEFAAARALLSKAFKAGEINLAEFQRLDKLLMRSSLHAEAFADSVSKMRDMSPSIQNELDANMKWLDQHEDMSQSLRDLERQFDPLTGGMKDLADARKLLQEGFDEGLVSDEAFARMNEGIDRATSSLENMHSVFQNMLRDSITALGEVRNLFAEDSAEAEALSSVMQLLNVVMGIQAVIKQLTEGDVYSAIPRAIGVAALVASMGVQTGASGSGSSQRSRQEAQGTGGVLGDAEAKTESILNAMEITAGATSELVGINRGMLHALQTLQTGLTGAVTQLARGDTDFGRLPSTDLSTMTKGLLIGPAGLLIDKLVGGFFGDILDKIFGGKVKVIDEGLQITGGTLNDLINGAMVQAFQEIKIKKNLFDDTDLKTKFADLDDDIAYQFTLVFKSIRDTVEQAAIAIGIPLDDIEARLASFEIETMKISLKDLTAEEQQQELLAVFGKIFDGLAEHVVPFIDQFQKVGEGLGETLVRVATSVQVMQEAVKAIGFAADEVDPEAFAQMSVELVEMTGGVEEFISKFLTFFDKFASEAKNLEFVTSQIERAFADVGLELPKTSDGMFDLMQSLDATTESGRGQIAMLLNIADVAAEYYDLVESAEEDRLKQIRQFQAFTGDTVFGGLLDLRDNFNAAMKAADALGASQKEYAMIARAFNTQLRRMAAELTLSVISQVKQLFGDEMGGIDDTLTDGLAGTREVANSVFKEWQRALEDIYDFTQSILLDEALTTLTPAEQFAESQSQFDKLLADAMAGDAEAAAQLPDTAKALLEEARFMFASGQRYEEIFNATLAALAGLEMPGGITPTIIEPADPAITGLPDGGQTEIDKLVETLEKFLMATDLAGTLRDLSQVLNESVIDLAKSLNVPLKELVEMLGIELNNISLSTADGLAEVAVLLGADIFELLDALDIGLHDLIAELPEAIQDDLGPLLEAIRIATTEADATTAIGSLGDYILDLPEDLQLLLTPLFNLFRPEDVAPELGALTGIEFNTAATVAAIHALIDTMGGVVPDPVSIIPDPVMGPLPDPNLPPPDEPPVLVTPIGVLPPPGTTPGGGETITKGDLAEIKTILSDALEQDRRYHENDLATSKDMESNLKQTAEQQRRISNA